MIGNGKRTYLLNGLLRLDLVADERYLSYFDNEYERMSTEAPTSERARLTLKVVDRVDHDAAREIHYQGLFRFRFAVEGLTTANPLILFERHWLDRLYTTPVGAFLQGQILEPVIYLKLLEAGVLFMHAASVSKDGKAYVFPAHGGTGKTTLSLALMKMGYELMGDDLLMVDSADGTVYPYARPLHLFEYNLRTLDVPWRIRAAIGSKSILRHAIALTTGRRFLISTRAHADKIMDVRLGSVSQLERLVFLKRDGDTEQFDLADSKARARAVNMIIQSADLNESLAQNVGMDGNAKELERKVIENVLRQVPQMTAVNARTMQTDEDRRQFARDVL